MATINSKPFIDSIIANNGWHESCLEDKDAPDNPRVSQIVEYINGWGITTWGVTFINEPIESQRRYELETQYVRSPKVIWRSSNRKEDVNDS